MGKAPEAWNWQTLSENLGPKVTSGFRRYWPLLAAGVLLVVMHSWAVRYWVDTWGKENGYYSHGPLVPFIAAVMIWANHKRMARVKTRSSWLGLLLMLPVIPAFLFGHWTSSAALLSATFFFFMIGAMLLITGTRMTRILLFPLLYLAFMVPLPSTLLDEATMKIQLQSTTLAAKMLDLSGYEVTQVGSEIRSFYLPQPLIVGVPCSGFKLLISLMTFTAFFAYMVNTTWWKKALLVAFAMPLSVFINALRITFIGYAGIWTESGEAMHSFHDYSGYIGLIICFVILFGFAKLIKSDNFGLIEPGPGMPPPDPEQRETTRKSFVGGYAAAAAIVLMAVLSYATFAVTPLSLQEKGKLDRAGVPQSFDTWHSIDLPIEKDVTELLWAGDLLQRLYTDDESGRQVALFMEAARDTTAFHDPHSCLPGSGNPITKDEIVQIKVGGDKPRVINATLLRTSSDYGSSVVIHWYMGSQTVYPNTVDMRQAVRKMQLNDFLNIAAHPANHDTIRRRIDSRQFHWYRFSTEVFGEDPTTDIEDLKRFISGFVANTTFFGE